MTHQTSRHNLLIALILLTFMPLHAQEHQERYQDLIARTQNLPPYEALYHMLGFQRSHPDHAPIYYRMGDVAYSLLPTKDALHNYTERAELLYRAKLFYGNCLYFMNGKMPRNEAFPTITPANKRVEYSDVEAYLNSRLDTVKRWKAETDTLHDRFYRMVDHYEQCRLLFLTFLEQYPSEKLAHLCLSDQDQQTLQTLTNLSHILEDDKRLFIEALHISPVPHYNPQFTTIPITMYRLDGVTSSDFLSNNITLWDYAQWTEAFLRTQKQVFQPLMRELAQEHNMLHYCTERFKQGLPVQVESNPLLLNRLERYDYQSPIATFLRLEQHVASTILQAQDSLTTNEQISDDALAARISASLEAHTREAETATLLHSLTLHLTPDLARKYAFFLQHTNILTLDQLLTIAQEACAFQHILTLQIEEQLQNYANTYPEQFEDVELPNIE